MGVHDRDYMRHNPGGPNRGWLSAAILGGLALIAIWLCYHQGGPRPMPGPGGAAGPRLKLLETRPVDLGTFEVASGEVAICDPGYDRKLVQEGAIAIRVRNVAAGTWQARAVLHVIDTPEHVRCGELLAFADAAPLPEAPAWKEVHRDIGVDSGQAGFFDWRHFHTRAAVPPDHAWKGKMLAPNDPWYSLCCDVTLHGDHAGVIPYGAVASSGWGDGGYPAYALRDDKGTVTGLRLVFIARDEYEAAEPTPVKPGPESVPVRE